MEIQDCLQELGYALRDDGKFWRAKAIYRDGGNPLSLRISKIDGSFVDFSSNENGDFKKLISLTLGLSEPEVEKKYGSFQKGESRKKDKIIFSKKIDMDSVGTFVRSYKYYLDRGISKETLDLFGAQLALSGKMYKRIVFPVHNRDGDIIGLSGRSIVSDSLLKWKHLGLKRLWVYPIHLNESFIKESRTVILVEGISDILTLWDCEIKNVLCLFGTKISPFLISEIVKLNPKRIFLATNNEPDNASIGELAAKEIQRKLSVFFNPSVISIALPYKKDFGVQTKEENLRWQKEYIYGNN